MRVSSTALDAGATEARSTLADDVRRGFAARPRSLPPKHLYDAEGCRLFDRICELPEYYLTRAEARLLEAHAADVARETGARTLVEIGSGMARKTLALLAAMRPRPVYVPFDIAEEALACSARALLAAMPGLAVHPVIGDFTRDLGRLSWSIPTRRPRLFAFLGSTIGNLDEDEAPALIRDVAALMREDDAFLLGADLVKDVRVLHAAYDDAQGVTARFNKNVLAVVNRELDADFDLHAFAHEAIFDARASRIEMRLVAEREQVVRIHRVGMRVRFAAGERILTEISRKLTRASIEETLARGGMRLARMWTGSDHAFALALARRA